MLSACIHDPHGSDPHPALGTDRQVLFAMQAMLKPAAPEQQGQMVVTNANTKLEMATYATMQTLSVMCEDEVCVCVCVCVCFLLL